MRIKNNKMYDNNQYVNTLEVYSKLQGCLN